MIVVQDQLNQTIRLESVPSRIVSLVPSITHYLADLGLEDTVVGITKFCILPEAWFRSKERIGGTKQVDIQKVALLKPDFIIANKEENTKEDIEALRVLAPVYVSDINTVEEAFDMMHAVAHITNRLDRGSAWIKQIKTSFAELKPLSARLSVLYFIWQSPYFVVGRDTYIHDVLCQIGFENACQTERYPNVNRGELHPEVILLSTEPFPFKEEHVEQFQLQYPKARVLLVSGESFSWYGSYMLQAVREFERIIAQLNR